MRSRQLEREAFPYADAAKLLRETYEALLPPRRITTAEHARINRWVKSPVGSHLEQWDHGTAPYLTQPMEVVDSGDHETAVIVGPGACGKTMVAENWLLKSIEADPAEFLWYMQSDPARDAYVKGRIEPMLEAHDKLIGSLRHGRDSVEFKRFRGMRAEFLSFHHNNLINKHVARIVLDEVDAYTIKNFLELANPRRQAAGADSMLLAISHPDRGVPLAAPRDRQAGIMAAYADSDRRMWWWPCPHCGGYSSPNPVGGRRMVISYDQDAPLDEIEAQAHLLCPLCSGKVTNLHRNAMNRAGKWIGLGQEIDDDGRVSGDLLHRNTAGWWIVGAMSPFTQGGIGGMAKARAAAEREAVASGDDGGLRTIMVKMWGEPFQPPRQLGAVDAQALAERADPNLQLGFVPEGVRFFTVAADAQGNRFEVIRRGWGVDGQSWVLSYERIEADPATSPEDWIRLFETLTTPLPLADGSGRLMKPRCAVFDAYGLPGTTDRAYEAWIRWRQAGLVKRLGVIDGRDAWSLLPSKGERGAAGRLQVVYPDARSDRRAAARGQVPVALFNGDSAKDDLAGQLLRGLPGAGYVNLPAGLIDKWPDFYDQLTAETRNKIGHWEKTSDNARNEVLDLMVGAHVAARLHGLRRLNWSKPPAWAAEWDQNSMVVAEALEAPAAEPLVLPKAPALAALAAAQAAARVTTHQPPPKARRYA